MREVHCKAGLNGTGNSFNKTYALGYKKLHQEIVMNIIVNISSM